MNIKNPTLFNGRMIDDPPITKLLFSDVRASVLWLLVRIYAGYQWVTAGLHKIEDPGWVSTGESLKAYWTRAVAIPATGSPPISPEFPWYRDFLTGLLNSGSYTWFGKVIAFGEFAVGVGLILGAFVGIAAFFGVVMNWAFIMAGSASTNGFLMILGVLLVVAWKVAGYLGADYFLLRKVGVPWKEGAAKVVPAGGLLKA